MARAGFFSRVTICLLSGIGVLFAFSCASTGSFARLDDAAGQSHYAESCALLEKKRASLYKKRDTILYCLDKGMLSHYTGQYAESSQLLEDGERAIEAAFTKSVTQAAGSYLINDNTIDYGGEDYEDIYINAFNALNYYNQGDIDEALVEIRRMSGKLENLSSKYNMVLSGLQKEAADEQVGQIPQNKKYGTKFSNSALARYLGMLFYRAAGMPDDTRIDSEWLRAAFKNAPAVYNFPPPASIAGELAIPAGLARLNVLAFAGLSPTKRELVQRIPIAPGHWIKIALPVMEKRRCEIARIALAFDNGGSYEMELLEDIEAVAVETFKAREMVIYLKTIIRATVKGLGSVALDVAAEQSAEKGNKDAEPVFQLLSFIAQIFADASERADTRISRYFPAKAYIGAVNVPPGFYSFQVKYYNRAGKEIARARFENFPVKENALNLAEAACLK